MKKILKNATEEQIAEHIRMNPEMWGITFPSYENDVTVEKDVVYDNLRVELSGVMLLKQNGFVKDTDACATLTISLDNINWGVEIECKSK